MATGLSANPNEYRDRLRQHPDEQLDAWVEELVRDVAVRRGSARVVADLQRSLELDRASFRHVFARGGGPASTVGLDSRGQLTVPAAALHCVVPGLRAETPEARERLIDYLVDNFGEIVYA